MRKKYVFSNTDLVETWQECSSLKTHRLTE